MSFAKIFVSLVIVCLRFSIGQSQWLETTIYVPDSLCGINYPQAFTYNTTNNKIYVGGGDGNCIIVIDGESNQKVARIPAGNRIYDLCWNSTNNKVYCADYYYYNGHVAVIDGATNSVITTVTVGRSPCALAWNSENNKVYCANEQSDNVTVIDGVTNSVITTITVGDIGDEPGAFTYNPQQNRVYLANYYSSSISVIRDEMPGIEGTPTIDASGLTPEIYPNPAKGVLLVRGPLSVKNIKIFDVSGKMVKELDNFTSAQSNKQEVRISLKGMNPGIYFLRWGSETKKFLVVK